MIKILKILTLIIIYIVFVIVLNRADMGYLPIGTIIIFALFVIFVLAGFLLKYTTLKKYTKQLYILGIITLLALITGFVITRVNIKLSKNRANTLIEKLEQYKIDKGNYPKNLDILVPNYLNTLPNPAFSNSDTFIYKVDCVTDTLELGNEFTLKYYAPLGMEAKYTSQKKQWEYDD